MTAYRIGVQNVRRHGGLGRGHQPGIGGDALGALRLRRGRGGVGPIVGETAAPAPEKADAVDKIAVKMVVVLDHLRQARVAQKGGALGSKGVAPLSQPIDNVQGDGGGE